MLKRANVIWHSGSRKSEKKVFCGSGLECCSPLSQTIISGVGSAAAPHRYGVLFLCGRDMCAVDAPHTDSAPR